HATERGITISEAALAMLGAYRWPGNVRELESAVRHALTLRRTGRATSAQLGPESFPGEVRQVEAHVPLVVGEPGQAERRALLLRALAGHGGNRSAAARALGIGRATFYRWWKDAGLGVFPGRA
ncbi:MAG TPA: helix-turn-helix domain-containing protein, partial [Gemmatimonadales bacterium]|nr:helix-turn-helix domain-containing protein [Gemmatimonadales bacterium]